MVAASPCPLGLLLLLLAPLTSCQGPRQPSIQDNSVLERGFSPSSSPFLQSLEAPGAFPQQQTSTFFRPTNRKPQSELLLPRHSSNSQALSQLSKLDSLISNMRKLAKQQAAPATPGGVDFSQATRQPDGRLCVIKEESVETLSKDPILECTHKDVEKCHYTYVTKFNPVQEEDCKENFEKICQITFKPQAATETVRKCYRPQRKICSGQGPEECRTEYESSCTTRYVEQTAGKFIGDTACQPVPVSVCGAGCVTEEGPEECHDKEIDTLVDVPEEVCDLNPQKTCRLVTRLVPSLEPQQECTSVPKEVCHIKFTQPSIQTKPLRTEWCLEGESQATSQAAPVYDREPSLPNYTGQLLQQLRRLRRQRQEERL